MSAKIRGLGIGILIIGVWGAMVPFVGPAFGYRMGNTPAWTWTESGVTVHLIPGIAAVLGGALMLGTVRSRVRLGTLLALAGGAWFILGPSIRPAWAGGGGMMMMGQSVWSQIAASVGYHYGTGVAVAILAAYALGALAATDRARRYDAPATGRSRERVSTAPSTNDRVSV